MHTYYDRFTQFRLDFLRKVFLYEKLYRKTSGILEDDLESRRANVINLIVGQEDK